MPPHRKQAGRVKTRHVCLFLLFFFALGQHLAASSIQAASGRELLKQGYRELTLLQTERALETYARALHSAGLTDEERAEAEAYMGLAYLMKGEEPLAREAFRRARAADRGYRPDMRLFSPWAAAIYEEVRKEATSGSEIATRREEMAGKGDERPARPPESPEPTHKECLGYADEGLAVAKTGELDRAIALLNRAIVCGKLTDKELAVVYRAGGKIRLNQGMADKALQLLNRSVELNPDDADAYNSLGAVWARKGNRQKAIESYSRAIALKPDFSLALKNRGANLRDLGRYDQAMADFNKAIQADPRDSVAFNERGMVYEKRGKHALALADFSRAIELNPDYTIAYYNRGLQYAKTRQFDQSLVDFNNTIARAPGFAQAYWSRSFIHEFKKQLPQAVADMETYVRMVPNNAAGKQRLSKLRSMR